VRAFGLGGPARGGNEVPDSRPDRTPRALRPLTHIPLTHIKVRMASIRIGAPDPAVLVTRAGRGERRAPYSGRTERRRERRERAAHESTVVHNVGGPGATGLIFLPNVLLKALIPGA